MIAELKPYPAMKDSGVEWLGEVPEHWEVRHLRTVLRNVTKRNRPDLQLLSVVREKGVIVRDVSNQDENHNFIPDDLTNYKVVREGQFAMNKMKAWQGSYGVSRYDGIVSPAYFVFDLDSVSGNYFNTAIRSKAYVPFFTQASDGVRIGQWDLSQVRMREIMFSIPPLSEQAAIVRYLDYVDRRVRRLTRAKRKLIALLTEQKQAIIHRAVTRGLDPDVSLKDSGVEWLGEVPEHWEVERGKTYFREVDVRSATGEEELLSVSHLTGVTPRSQKNITMFKAESYVGSKVCEPGQIAVNTMWAWMAAIGVSSYRGLISPSYHTYEQVNSTRFAGPFLDLLLRTGVYKDLYTINSSGITTSRLRLYPDDFLNIRFLCPPRQEQEAILSWLHQASADIDTAITSANREIELLNEYRTRLIADVVTGNLDVRDAAAALPEVDPLDTEDYLDDALETDAKAELDDLDAIPEEAEA